MRNRLRRSAREAIRNEYRDNVIYLALKTPCEHFGTKMPKFRLSAEEVFLECLTVLDDIKEDESRAAFNIEHRWDSISNDFRDLADNNVQEDEIALATSVVMFCVVMCLTIAKKQLYSTLALRLMDQIVEHDAYTDELKDTFMANVYRLGEGELKEVVLEYMESDKFLSDEIEEMARDIKEESNCCDDVKKKNKKQQEQFTNRQLIILFEELLGVTLYSGGPNINAFSKLLGLVSGHSPGSIRNNIPQDGLDYKYDPQTKKDAEYVASCLESVSKNKANSIRVNVE